MRLVLVALLVVMGFNLVLIKHAMRIDQNFRDIKLSLQLMQDREAKHYDAISGAVQILNADVISTTDRLALLLEDIQTTCVVAPTSAWW